MFRLMLFGSIGIIRNVRKFKDSTLCKFPKDFNFQQHRCGKVKCRKNLSVAAVCKASHVSEEPIFFYCWCIHVAYYRVKYSATSRKVAGSIPDCVIGIFH
jgi:hypothetical protein